MLNMTLDRVAEWVGIVAGIAAVVGLVAYFVHRRRDRMREETAETRRDRELAQQQASERAAAWAEKQRVLDSMRVTFTAEARPTAGNAGPPPLPPLYLYAHGDTPVWVSAVHLTWWRRQGDRAEPQEAALLCAPWDEANMPLQLQPDSKGLAFDWPAARRAEPEAISWELHVTWGAERLGPTMTTIVGGGSTNWQQV